MKKILLTGGSGFIGRNIRESYLAEKYEITAPTHAELDLLDEDAVARFIDTHNCDYLIHAAAKPGHRNSKEPDRVLYENSRIFFNLAKNNDKFEKTIITASGAIYDMRHYQPKMQEEYFGEHIPIDEHGLNKYIIGQYIENKPNIIDLRIFGIFGKYEDYAIRFISNMICKTIFDIPLTIKQNRKFDYLYVDDLMPILDFFMDNNLKYNSYNVTPDSSIELLEIANKVLEISGKKLPIIISQDGLGLEYSGDNQRLRSEMKQINFSKIDQSISCLYEWYFDRKNNLNKTAVEFDK